MRFLQVLAVAFLLQGCAFIRSVNLDVASIIDPLEGCDISASPFGAGDGSISKPFLICSDTHLKFVATDLTKNYKLVKDLDLTLSTFTPIGADHTTGFSGTFDGNNHTLSNWTYSDTSAGFSVSFVRYLMAGGVIKNLSLTNAALTGNNFTAGIAGVLNGTIQNVNVSGTFISKALVGGIAGIQYNPASLIDHANVSSGTVYSSADGSEVSGAIGNTLGWDMGAGGLVGTVYEGTISNSESHADVSWEAVAGTARQVEGWTYCGGLAGYFNTATITDSTAYGSVSGYHAVGGAIGTIDGSGTALRIHARNASVTGVKATGGIVGRNAGNMTNSDFIGGTVTSTQRGGGIAGENWKNISSCFALGDIEGDTIIGGIVGYNRNTGASGNIHDVYFRGSVAGVNPASSDYIGGGVGYNEVAISNALVILKDLTNSNAASVNFHNFYGIKAAGVVSNNVYYRDGSVSVPDPEVNISVFEFSAPESISQPSFASLSFDFTVTPVWRLPSTNPNLPTRTPVLAWQCGVDGVVCP